MPAIKKLVAVKRKILHFDLRKKYYNKKRYRISEKTPLDRIVGEMRKSIFPSQAKGPDGNQKSGTSIVTIAIAIIVVVLLAALGFNALFGGAGAPQIQPVATFTRAPSFSAQMGDYGIATLGARSNTNSNVAYYRMSYFSNNTYNITVITDSYPSMVPNQVFMLISKRDQASTYSQFLQALKIKLDSYGIQINEIDLEEIDTLPGGALLLVPSGLIPKKMVEPGGANILELCKRGVDVLYIGNEFGYSIDEMGNKREISSTIEFPFSFEPANIGPSTELNLKSSLYKVTGRNKASNMIYKMVSFVNINPGNIIFVPQVLDNGWGEKKYSSAADDISKMIIEMKWRTPQATSTAMLDVKNGNRTNAMVISALFSEKEKSIIVRIIARNQINSTERTFILYPHSDVNGDLYYINNVLKIVSGRITQEDTGFQVILNENGSEKTYLFMSLRNVSNQEVLRNSISPTKTELQGGQLFYQKLNLPNGIYLASIVDADNKSYAKSVVWITDVEFQSVRADFSSSIFRFKAIADGNKFTVKNLTVTLDNGTYGNWKISDLDEFDIDVRDRLPGSSLASGNHTFEFMINDMKKTIVLEKKESTNISENPLYWIGMAVVGILVVLLAPMLAGLNNKIDYSLDIPDFPPLISIKIPMKKAAVSGVFEKVNEDYRWKNVPLRLEEIKKGFKKIIYQNKPVFISDYNLEYILENMEQTGEISHQLGYYGLVKWEKEISKSIRYLSMYRKIRDMCISQAAPFTKIGEAKECDVKLTGFGQTILVYIIDSPSVWEERLTMALKQIQKNIVVLLFESQEDKKDFEDKINSASESGGLVKLEIINCAINPLTMDELEKMIKEMKIV